MAYPDTVDVKDAGNVTRQVAAVAAKGRQAATGSIPVALATEDIALLGPSNETAPAGDTDPSGLNGRMQRLAQQQTTLKSAFDLMALDIASLLAASEPSVTSPFLSAVINIADASTATDVIAATAATKIRIYMMELEWNALAKISLYANGTGGTLLRPYGFKDGGVKDLPYIGYPYFELPTNEKLTLDSDVATAVTGIIYYTKVA